MDAFLSRQEISNTRLQRVNVRTIYLEMLFQPGTREVALALFDGTTSVPLPLHVRVRAAVQSQSTDTKVGQCC